MTMGNPDTYNGPRTGLDNGSRSGTYRKAGRWQAGIAIADNNIITLGKRKARFNRRAFLMFLSVFFMFKAYLRTVG